MTVEEPQTLLEQPPTSPERIRACNERRAKREEVKASKKMWCSQCNREIPKDQIEVPELMSYDYADDDPNCEGPLVPVPATHILCAFIDVCEVARLEWSPQLPGEPSGWTEEESRENAEKLKDSLANRRVTGRIPRGKHSKQKSGNSPRFQEFKPLNSRGRPKTEREGVTIEGFIGQGKVARDEETGCLNWKGALTTAGSPNMRIDGKSCLVHKIIFENHKGEVEDIRNIAKTCSNKLCINPEHMYLEDV